MDRILNMILRQLVRRGVDLGIRKGADMMASRHNAGDEAAMQADGAKNAKRAKQAMRVARRVGRM